jgi:hypothetical protein
MKLIELIKCFDCNSDAPLKSRALKIPKKGQTGTGYYYQCENCKAEFSTTESDELSVSTVELDTELAKKIIEKKGLPISNLAKWKFRKEIPSKYFETQSPEIGKSDVIYPKIVEILGFKEVAGTKFRTFAKRPQRVAELISETKRMTEEEKLLFFTEISEMRNALARLIKVFNETNIKAIMKDMRFHHSHIFPARLLSAIHQSYFNLDRFDKNEIAGMKSEIALLYNRLKI